ncbi:MAG: hypothetical protein IPO22_06875 [Anaerolineales bacterium]|nr:hypothetical protein [Anaerolineales bacterium]
MLAAILFIGAGVEFYHVASGTGNAVGAFSITWLLLFFVFSIFCLALFAGIVLQRHGSLSSAFAKLISWRNGIKFLRWVIAVLVIAFPVWFLQYTKWGIVFHGFYIRALIWITVVFIFAFLASSDDTLAGWKELLAALALTAASFSIAISLQNVTDYPFSLGWSEGNRLWDYSTLFGKAIYNVREDDTIYVLLDQSRLLIGGLPFLIPGLTIEMERLWLGLTTIIPYFLVGLAAFRIVKENNRSWPFIILWIFLFLKQGPIHSPLVLSAALTILIWGRSLWISIPLVVYAGFFAQASRYTWMFAPGIWIGMLELAGASLLNGKLVASQWARAIALGIAGLFGGYLLPKMLPLLLQIVNPAPTTPVNIESVGEQIAGTGNTAESIASEVSRQPLLWYRLLPNSTYGNGILIGLLIAVLPLLVILFWLAITKKWALNLWQKLALTGSLLAFLAVGLVASTKIGGGGDLHNMDMFLIGLAFTGLIAWYNGGREAILNPSQLPVWMKVVIVAALVIPALGPWRQMRSFQYGEQATALAVLADAPDEKSLDLLPSDEKINRALEKIQDASTVAVEEGGEVLFLDQRQLLTFGYIKGIPLVPQYEKKVLMNEALSGNAEYFQTFYNDLAAHRFSLIVSEKLFTPIKDSSFEFGEENNAWVTWVTKPLLCYYQEASTQKEVGVQLLIPRETPVDCDLP